MAANSKKAPSPIQPRFEFRWENFRSFADSGWIEVRPLTVLIGPNNSGKTSLLLPLLLMKQTLDSRDPAVALKTMGPLVDVGTFRDLVFRHKADESVSFNLRFRYPKDSGPKKEIKPVGAYAPGRASFEFTRGAEPTKIDLRRLEIHDLYDRLYLLRTLRRGGNYGLQFVEDLAGKFGKAVRDSKPEHFFFPSVNLLFQFIREEQRKKRRGVSRKKGLKIPENVRHYFDVTGVTQFRISELLSQLSYVGPLRQHPKRFYEISEELPESVGLRGEDAPQILFLKRDAVFLRDVRRWLRTFQLADSIRCESLHRGIFAVRIWERKKASEVDFADTGFGLSQLLPLIVQGFHAKAHSIIFMEQPEIHLNPKMQCTLANLFAAIAGADKTVIVETHSEHLVLRLRSLIAEGELKPQDVALYFVEKQKEESSVRRIPIQEDGHIEPQEWPKRFFEDSIGEALRLARSQPSQKTK
ncbi:MAG: DUF3696 domain-containing protein [Terriglobia bacterium]